MHKVCILFINSIIMISRIFGARTMHTNNILRRTLIFDDKMPSIYTSKYLYIQDNLKNSAYSIEHIFPRCMLNKKEHNDMHNTIKTLNDLNVNRSNYRYTDVFIPDKHWLTLDYDNYVNHKLKLFIPNRSSRGFISRAILYMCKEYNYSPHKIIDKNVLLQWFFTFPPEKQEKHHNEIVYKIQNKNNIFISNYNKKTKQLLKYLNDL